MKKLIFALLMIIIVIIISSCSQSNSFVTPTLSAPVVPGIELIDCDGNHWGSWLYPYSPSFEFPGDELIWHYYLRCAAYPNPSNGYFSISYDIPDEGNVKITVVSALPPGSDPETHLTNYNNSTFVILGGNPIRTLLDQSLSQGSYNMPWDTRDDFGNKVPDGFYRIYLEWNEYLVWYDVFNLNDLNNLPPGMMGPFSG